ncbi:hypothetical protein O4C33_10380, partial [Bifidobacterium breve]|uniref:hypothetical protein n=1 Tax=Bifidobacterium breve TaxID=1685 RepID=UPI0022AEC239
MSPSHPGHRQWHPRSECTRGRAFPGSVEAAFSSIRLASSALGVFCQIFVGRFGVSFSPFERLFLGRFGFGQSCGLSVIA